MKSLVISNGDAFTYVDAHLKLSANAKERFYRLVYVVHDEEVGIASDIRSLKL
jgi:hypothetical protein